MYHTLHPEASLHVGGARDPEPLRFGAHIEAVSQPKDTRGPRASNWSGQWGSNQWQKEWTGEEVSLSQKISGDELREVVGLLARLALKHEDTEAAVRSDTSFILYMNTRGITITRTLYDMAQDWRKLKEEGRLNQSLRVTLIIGLLAAMKEKMKTALREEIRPTLEKHKWITQSNPPAWAYMTWNAAKEEQEVDAQKPPLPHDQAERTVQRIFELISMEGLLMKFHVTRPHGADLQVRGPPLRADSLQPREPGAAQPLSNPVQQRLPLPGRDSHASRSHEEAAPGGSSQRKGLQPPGCDQSVPGYEDGGDGGAEGGRERPEGRGRVGPLDAAPPTAFALAVAVTNVLRRSCCSHDPSLSPLSPLYVLELACTLNAMANSWL